MSKELVNAIADMREEKALMLVKEMVKSGSDPMAILDLAREAMTVVGQRYDEGAYFLPELMLAGEMLNQITDGPADTTRHLDVEVEARHRRKAGSVGAYMIKVRRPFHTIDPTGFSDTRCWCDCARIRAGR